MSEILNKVRNVDPNNNDTVKEVLTSFFQNIVKYTEVNCNQWLRSLEDVLSRFPRYCSTHKATIETYLTHFLNCSNYYDVIQAAKCAHALQQVPWPQDKTVTAKSAWRDQMALLCDSAHSLIDALFIDSVDLYKRSNNKNRSQKNTSSPLTAALCKINSTGSTGATNKHALLQIRLRNTFIFIQAMIVEIYPVPKPIQPQTILNVIVRALSVTSSKKSQTTDVAPLKIQALRTLDALNACLGANLIPFSPLVFRIVMQTFRWTSDNQTDGSRQVRQHTYNSLGNWLTTLHSHRLTAGNTWEDELTNHIIGDITPIKKTVQLTMSGGQPLKNLSKKARRKLQNRMLQDSAIAAHIPGDKNKLTEDEEITNDVAKAALGCAEIFLSVCGVFLKPTTHKQFQEQLVRECFNSSAYSDEYLLALLRTLEVSRKTTPSTVPPPTQYCLQLYSTLSNNQCTEIAKFCTQALLDIRMHLHCSPPSLNFALEVSKEKSPIEKSKVVSERNREALKKLLGDRNPDQESNIEVITIHDEPMNKKPRLEDPDNISISSESVCSVDVTDNSKNDEEPKEVFSENEITEEINTKEITDIDYDHDNEDIDMDGPTLVEEVDEIAIVIREERAESMNIKKMEDVDQIQAEKTSIYEAKTQLELNTSNDNVDIDDQTLHMEVAYDLPTIIDNKVRVLDVMDDENLPSTNETDDVQITCGQVVLTSQENEVDKSKESEEIVLEKKQKGETIEVVTLVVESGAIGTEEAIINVGAEVNDNAITRDGTIVTDDAKIDVHTEVNDNSITRDGTIVTDDAKIDVHTEVNDNSITRDGTIVTDDAKIDVETEVNDDAVITGDIVVTNGVIETNLNETKKHVPCDIADELSKHDGISVEDMMADFVDEVNEQTAEA